MKRYTTTRTTTRVILTAVLAALCASLAVSGLSHGTAHLGTSAAASSDPIAVGNWNFDQYDAIIVQQAQSHGLNPFLIKGQIMLESAFNANAYSPTNDMGLMQIKYATAEALGYSGSWNGLYDPSTNVQYGCVEMQQLMSQFGDVNLALQAYNIGSYGVANGQRNWAYSTAVMNYVTQFENEHASLYGSSSSGSGGSSSSSSSSPGMYTVQPGDTLSLIASKYGTSYQSLASANGIAYPYLIYPGEQLHVSGGGGSGTYTVRSGDTLWQIGMNYGVSWQSIAQANGIYSPYLIFPGEQLTIP